MGFFIQVFINKDDPPHVKLRKNIEASAANLNLFLESKDDDHPEKNTHLLTFAEKYLKDAKRTLH